MDIDRSKLQQLENWNIIFFWVLAAQRMAFGFEIYRSIMGFWNAFRGGAFIS